MISMFAGATACVVIVMVRTACPMRSGPSNVRDRILLRNIGVRCASGIMFFGTGHVFIMAAALSVEYLLGIVAHAAVWPADEVVRDNGGARAVDVADAADADADADFVAAPARDPQMQRNALLDIARQHGGFDKIAKISAVRRSAGVMSGVSRFKQAGSASSKRLRSAALRAQVAILNRTRAAKSDDLLPEPHPMQMQAVRSGAVKGKGQYKTPTVEQVQRDVFAPPSRTMISIAGEGRSSRYITDWCFASAFTLLRLQAEAVSSFLSDKVAAVVQLIFDESKHGVLYRGRVGRATQTSTLAVHGRVLGLDGLFSATEDELVTKPVAIESNCASCMCAGLENALPSCIFDLIHGGPFVHEGMKVASVCLGCDEHSANKFLVAYLEERYGDNILLWVGWCRQHGVGNVLEPAIRLLGILSPSFCLAKRLRDDGFFNRLEKGIKAELKDNMWHVRRSVQPLWQPDESHLAHARALLDMAYKSRLLFEPPDGDSDTANEAARQKRLQARQERIDKFLRHFTFDWTKRSSAIVFYDNPLPEDGRDEFQNRNDAVDFAASLITDMGLHVLGDPASNKWLTVWQFLNQVLLMMSFGTLLTSAWRRASNVEPNEEDDVDSEISEGELLGMDSSKTWHKRERRRDLKGLGWIEKRTTLFKICLFMWVAGKVMQLHSCFQIRSFFALRR